MYKKPPEMPLFLLKIDALLRRTSKTHPKRAIIQATQAKTTKGYQGELSLQYHLSPFLGKDFFIYHNLRLKQGEYYFQLDYLILHPKFILLLEVKNIAGTVLFDNKFDQLIRIYDGKEEGFNNPLYQVKKQEENLKRWLTNNRFPPLPVESFIVFSNPKTIIKATPHFQAFHKIIHSQQLSEKIELLEKKYHHADLTEREMVKLSRMLARKHEENDNDILERFNMEKKEVIKGVQCPQCTYIPVRREDGKWTCEMCSVSSSNAHLPAIKDIRLLFGRRTNHQQVKEFLLLDSPSITTKILTSLGLPTEGKTKNRTYLLPK